MKSLKAIIIEYAEARGGGLPLTAQEMCNAVVLWCQQYLNETSGETGVVVKEREGKLIISADMTFIEGYIKENLVNATALSEMLEGSETVVIDVSEDGQKLEIHLDYSVVNKLDRAVLTPTDNPTEPEFPLLGVNGSILWAPLSAFGGGGEGTKLYEHSISLGGEIGYVSLICAREAPFTYTQLYEYFNARKGIISFRKDGKTIVEQGIPPTPSLGMYVYCSVGGEIKRFYSDTQSGYSDEVTAL